MLGRQKLNVSGIFKIFVKYLPHERHMVGNEIKDQRFCLQETEKDVPNA
jgi:hypothetical protein